MNTPQENGEEKGTQARETVLIPLDHIEPDPDQPRKGINDKNVAELRQTIEQDGVLTPIWLRPKADGGGYIIIAGHRRFHAAGLAGLPEIPAHIYHVDEKEARRLQLIENLQRQDLDPLEEAEGYNRLITEMGTSQQEAAKALGKDDGYISAIRQLNDLDAKIKREYQRGTKQVSKWLLIEVARCEDEKAQRALWRQIKSGDIKTVKAAQRARRSGESAGGGDRSREEIRKELGQKIAAAKRLIDTSMNFFPEHDREYRELVNFSETLAAKVAELRREFGDPKPADQIPERKRGRPPRAKTATATDAGKPTGELPQDTVSAAEAGDQSEEGISTPTELDRPA